MVAAISLFSCSGNGNIRNCLKKLNPIVFLDNYKNSYYFCAVNYKNSYEE